MLRKNSNSGRMVLCPNEEPPAAQLPDRLMMQNLKEGVVYPIRTRQGQSAIVVLRHGKAFAYDAKCPHMGADLTVAHCVGRENYISCPWHGYQFNGETGVIAGNPNEAAMRAVRVASPNFDPDMKPPFKLRDLEIEIRDDWLYAK